MKKKLETQPKFKLPARSRTGETILKARERVAIFMDMNYKLVGDLKHATDSGMYVKRIKRVI